MSSISEVAGPAELIDYLKAFPRECALGGAPVTEVFDRYHVAEHVVISDGIALDREALLAHATGSRKRVAGLSVEVTDALVDYPRIAARYVLSVQMRRGLTIATEIYAFGRLARDRRICQLDQITRPVASGDPQA